MGDVSLLSKIAASASNSRLVATFFYIFIGAALAKLASAIPSSASGE